MREDSSASVFKRWEKTKTKYWGWKEERSSNSEYDFEYGSILYVGTSNREVWYTVGLRGLDFSFGDMLLGMFLKLFT